MASATELPSVLVPLHYVRPRDAPYEFAIGAWEAKGLRPPALDAAANPYNPDNQDVRDVAVTDVRPALAAFQTVRALDERGFMHHKHMTGVARDEFHNGSEALLNKYYPETAALVQRVTGASRVLVFDHVIRSAMVTGIDSGKAYQKGDTAPSPPVALCHNDYTEDSAPQRVRQLSWDIDPRLNSNTVEGPLLSRAEAEHLLATHRYAFINVWRSIGPAPVRDHPLAVCDGRSFSAGDLMNLRFHYPDRKGEIKVARYSPTHRWLYVSELTQAEVLLIKCFDSERGGVPSAHTGFRLPAASIPPGCPPRESIEVRTVAFWPKGGGAKL